MSPPRPPQTVEEFLEQVFPEGVEDVRGRRARLLAIVTQLEEVNERVERLPSSDEVRAIFGKLLEILTMLLREQLN